MHDKKLSFGNFASQIVAISGVGGIFHCDTGTASASGAGKISAARVAVDVQQQQQPVDEEEDDLMEENGANRSTGGVFDLY